MTAADVDGDGAVDLVTERDLRQRFGLRNLGNGTFAAQVTYAVGNGSPSVTAADVDGDGAVDLVTTNYFSGTVFRSCGTWATVRSPHRWHYAVGDSVWFVTAADVDGDGAVDLVTATAVTSNTVSVLRNLGDGTFAAQVTYAVGTLLVL